ncbi:MAG: co-chaperone GroES [Candidatus Abyssobacteria bacterium SURF_5]|uniref:Co-chaperonin GroES n=1 Tax=Abyssobacteria bacterium (strain SURF_5) TaxID=2093360 RepID=A0A3A4NVU1_ABYX5|nr:MAG: co-chaperone GroES [Candidatus Abyssubacteria bacterium SURF_5]
MKLKPLKDNIVVKVLEAEAKTGGGLFLPDTAKEKPQKAKVIAVGSGRRLKGGDLVPPSVKKGDTVLFGKYSGSEVRVDKDEYLILSEKDILAILEE